MKQKISGEQRKCQTANNSQWTEKTPHSHGAAVTWALCSLVTQLSSDLFFFFLSVLTSLTKRFILIKQLESTEHMPNMPTNSYKMI